MLHYFTPPLVGLLLDQNLGEKNGACHQSIWCILQLHLATSLFLVSAKNVLNTQYFWLTAGVPGIWGTWIVNRSQWVTYATMILHGPLAGMTVQLLSHNCGRRVAPAVLEAGIRTIQSVDTRFSLKLISVDL